MSILKRLIPISALLCAGLPWAQAKKPNIILIMADDMGFSDIGAFGSEITTPNLDKLAVKGIRYTQFYNTSRCCPTRASLLTGLYSHEAGVGHMTDDESATKGPGYLGHLNNNCVTLAEVLRTAGYATYMVGKWHVSHGPGDMPDWPVQRGFDRFFGGLSGPEQFFGSTDLMSGNTSLPKQTGKYATYAFSDTAVKYIDEHVASGTAKPFFLYLPHHAPHFPLQAPDSLIARYRGKYMAGWTALRKARYARQLASGLIDPKWPLSPDDGLVWDTLSASKKDEMDLRMSIYAAMIEAMDQGIGQVMDALQKHNLTENTLVLFLSDNGGNLEGGLAGGGPASDLGKHLTIPMLTYGQSWGNASNTPFREYKHFSFEGGISTPLLAVWPKGITVKDRWETQPGHLTDIMPTLVELSGATYPTTFQGNTIKPMEGISLVPTFTGKALNRTKPIFFEHEGNRAIRDGKWKLVALDKKPWELYDMEADRSELNNLAAKDPARVAAMTTQWNDWAVRANVVWTPTGLRPSQGALPKREANAKGVHVKPDVNANARPATAAGIRFTLPVDD